ncbi:glycosyltransferase domain-containing protein [Chitinophaga sp. MM2321]|uniref:glycosyltransferase domain-containing protein n=1 Tax=Chitinophaga sp. MM2321 TaxID=3137178 RepID=UPI0032D57F53
MRRCVYTVILGDYDEPKPIPIRTPGFDYILFTDNDRIVAPGWQVRIIAKCENVQRKQREIKILAHKYLPDYNFTIYLDGSTAIRRDIGHLVKSYFRGGMLLKRHPSRDCVYQEGLRCIEINKAPVLAIEGQLEAYKNEGIPAKMGLYETGIILRDNNPEVNAVCEAWWKELFKTCNRDQISLPVVMRRMNFTPSVIPFNIAHIYIKVMQHKATVPEIKPMKPRVWYLTPFSTEKDIGGEYNAQIARVPQDDWVCIRDGDTIFLTPDNQWGKQIEDIVQAATGKYDLIGCITNRLRATTQLYKNEFSNDHNMLNHGKIAKELYEANYDSIKQNKGPVAGLFLLFPRRTWDKVKFREKCDTFDTHFGKELIKKGGKIGIAEGVYLYHWYRAWSQDPLNYKKHLLK